MKLSFLLLWLAFPPISTVAQTPTATSSDTATLSDHEKNIRAYIELLRSDVRAREREVMEIVMALNANEGAKFWPIYQDFEGDMKNFYDGVADLVREYKASSGTMGDDEADRMATKLLDLEQQRNDIKRKYYERIKAALDPVVAMKFLEVENQIERVIDLQVASNLPVAQRSKP